MNRLDLEKEAEGFVLKILRAVHAADAVVKAAKHHVHSQAMSHPPCELCGLIAAYEKVRASE